jgi:hypothetical protein
MEAAIIWQSKIFIVSFLVSAPVFFGLAVVKTFAR